MPTDIGRRRETGIVEAAHDPMQETFRAGEKPPRGLRSGHPAPSMPSPTAPAVGEIGQIAIVVSDVARATTFYRDVLGLKFLFHAGPNLAFLAAGSVRLMLTTPQGHGAPGHNSVLYFKTDDLPALHAAVVARGGRDERAPQLTAKMPDHDLWIGFVRDPDGNLVGLMSEVRK